MAIRYSSWFDGVRNGLDLGILDIMCIVFCSGCCGSHPESLVFVRIAQASMAFLCSRKLRQVVF